MPSSSVGHMREKEWGSDLSLTPTQFPRPPCVLGLLGSRRRMGTGLPGETTSASDAAVRSYDPPNGKES